MYPRDATGKRLRIGWREWVRLPELGGALVRAKIDTGARTSALHAFDLQEFDRDGERWARFTIHPLQRSGSIAIEVEAMLVDRRRVRDSGGRSSLRPVVVTPIELMGQCWPIELTLTRRDTMGFRMLIGRAAVRRRFVVDPGRSFLAGKPSPSNFP